MSVPQELSYTKDHEWVGPLSGPTAKVGITAYAAEALGDVVFVDLPEIGTSVQAGQECGEIESTKSVSTLFSPVSGEVTAVNEAVVDAPELVNADPYGAGWLLEVAPAGDGGELLGAGAYQELIEALSKEA